MWHKSLSLVLLLACLTVACSQRSQQSRQVEELPEPQQWFTLSSAEYHFNVSMPTKPYPTKLEDELLSYTSNSDGVYFYVKCSEQPKAVSPEWFFKTFPGVHTSYPAGGPMGVKRLLDEAGVDFAGDPAHEYRFSEDGGKTLHVIRVYFAGKYQYMLGVISTPADKVEDADMQRFFSSFQRT